MPKIQRPRPNIPFDGKTAVRYDNDYYLNKVVFSVLGGVDLWIRFCNGRAPKKTEHNFFVDSFRTYTAVEVIQNINDFNATSGTNTQGEWGRHFEDGVLEIWHTLRIPLGWVKPILY